MVGHEEVMVVVLEGAGVEVVRRGRRVVGEAVADGGTAATAEELVRGAFHDNFALDHDGDAVGEVLGFVHVVGGEKDGLTEILEVPDHAPSVPTGGGIEAGGGFVEEQEIRVAGEADSDVEATLLTAREFLDAGLAVGAEAGGLEHVFEVHRVGVVATIEVDGLFHVEVGLDAGGLEDDADALAEGGLLAGRVVAEDADFAGGPGEIAFEDFDGCGLAGAVGAEEGEDLACGDLEVDAANGVNVAEGLTEAADVYGGGATIHGRLSERREC